jgi:hypothetical protein
VSKIKKYFDEKVRKKNETTRKGERLQVNLCPGDLILFMRRSENQTFMRGN